ncbi:serine/threonine-protein kinase [Clostridium sp. UBA1652]|uniref:serine/threonine-protein kinase n=1 Tax=Clostridium sp. UBA1652 TaxID=1946348 RepID=UPI002580215E|nr:serine/threonine-protein kinase [Clostridium sp. UBA1652]
MTSHQIFKIDENHIGLEINKIYVNDYRFPVEMIVNGKKYTDVELTLNKPHGKKIIMDFMIKILLKGPKQYKSFANQVLQKSTWFDFNDALEILLLDGIIEITFKNQKPGKMMDWIPKKIQLDSRVTEVLSEELPDYNLEAARLKELVVGLTIDVKSEIRVIILQWMKEEKIRDQSGDIITDFTSFKKYKSIILIAAYYISLKEKEKKVPLRHLSNKIWNQPKVLNNYKKESAKSLGITLDELESVLLPDINSNLHRPLILITPIEELQKLLDKIFEAQIQHNLMALYMEAINYYIQKIIEVLEESYNSNFLSAYNLLKEEVMSNRSKATLETSLKKLKDSIYNLKNEMLKADYIRQQFELIVLQEIGSGSFARVFKVFDPESNEIVACKVLFPRNYFKQCYGNDGDEYILRFKREARLLNKELSHKNIINVMKIHLDGSLFWFTMPLASCSLEKWIKSNRHSSLEQRINIFKEIISGVKYLHKENKHHRDLAPNNILIYETNNGMEVKIADFGLAKDPQSTSFFTGLSKKGYGQENFTDPEQLNSLADATHLSDIYSLGALLYYLLSNKLPKKRFYAPVFCQEVVMKAMSKREQRHQTIYEFENDLNH